MLNITDHAGLICSETVQQLSVGANTKLLRFSKTGAGVSISFELPRRDDKIVLRDGQAVLAVPDDLIGELSGMTLDVSKEGRLVLS